METDGKRANGDVRTRCRSIRVEVKVVVVVGSAKHLTLTQVTAVNIQFHTTELPVWVAFTHEGDLFQP